MMATLSPTSAFMRVDLPALGRPTKQAKPDRNVSPFAGIASTDSQANGLTNPGPGMILLSGSMVSFP